MTETQYRWQFFFTSGLLGCLMSLPSWAGPFVCFTSTPTSTTFTADIDVTNGSARTATGTFQLGADGGGRYYDIWLSVPQANIDNNNDVYLAKDGSGNALPLNVNLHGVTSQFTVNANSANIQTGGPSTAWPSSNSPADGSNVKGTDSGGNKTTYTITLTQNNSLNSTYHNIPNGTYTIPITVNMVVHGTGNNGDPDMNRCATASSTGTSTATATVASSISISTDISTISLGTIDLFDGAISSSFTTFIMKANGTSTAYDVWLSVPQANLDAVNDIYLASNGANSLPLRPSLTGNSGGNAVIAYPAELQTGAPSTAKPTTGNKADGDGVQGTDLLGTTYTVTISETSLGLSTYPNIPSGTYTVTITTNIAQN